MIDIFPMRVQRFKIIYIENVESVLRMITVNKEDEQTDGTIILLLTNKLCYGNLG